jgi:hypothetical protein
MPAFGKPARAFRDFWYCTHKSWSRTRRVVGKAEHTLDGANPRFVVTSLKRTHAGFDARALYEDLYCVRGEAENRNGEQFELFADRVSSATMAANQLRMWLERIYSWQQPKRRSAGDAGCGLGLRCIADEGRSALGGALYQAHEIADVARCGCLLDRQMNVEPTFNPDNNHDVAQRVPSGNLRCRGCRGYPHIECAERLADRITHVSECVVHRHAPPTCRASCSALRRASSL